MSYALDLTVDARRSFGLLGLELQERVLNELDAVAEAPDSCKWLREEAVIDFVHETGGERQYVFIVLVRDAAARTIRVKAIGYAKRAD